MDVYGWRRWPIWICLIILTASGRGVADRAVVKVQLLAVVVRGVFVERWLGGDVVERRLGGDVPDARELRIPFVLAAGEESALPLSEKVRKLSLHEKLSLLHGKLSLHEKLLRLIARKMNFAFAYPTCCSTFAASSSN